MNYYIFLYLSLLCALFLNTDAAAYLGIKMLTTAAFTPIMLAVFLKTLRSKVVSKNNVPSIMVFTLSLIIIAVKFVLGEDVFRLMLNFTILPICIIGLVFNNINQKEKALFQKALILFYVVECSLAIVERVLSKRFFDTIFVTDRYDSLNFEAQTWQFRSTSLLGHPLENAMAVAILLSFILFSKLKLSKIISLFSLGYLSLFCFNARGAIIVVTFILLPVFLKTIIKNNRKYKGVVAFGVILLAALAGSFIIFSGLGGRLLNSASLIDSSSIERINVFKYINYLKPEKLVFGDLKNYSNLLERLGLVGIENGVITAILMYGYVLAIPLLLSLFYFQWQKLKSFGSFARIIILSTFWLLGLMNPNLVDPTQWYIFIFSFLSFKPEPYVVKTSRGYNTSAVQYVH